MSESLLTSTMAVRHRWSAHRRSTGRGAHAGPRKGSGQHLPWSYPCRTFSPAPSGRRPRESLDGFLQVCVGGLQRFLQFFRLDDLCSAPVAPAPTRAGKRSYEQAVLHHDQVEDVASGTHTLTGLPVVFPAMTRARPANLSDSVPASLDRAACVVCARSGARLSTAAIATAHAIVLVRIVLIDISCSRLYSDCCVVPAAQGFHKSINSLLFVTENRQFHKFIIITMILTSPHDSAIRWEEVLRVL